MKKIAGILSVLFVIAAPSYATPERIEIKKQEQRSRERAARLQIASINLDDIEDPAAKRAIGEILNYLNLSSQR